MLVRVPTQSHSLSVALPFFVIFVGFLVSLSFFPPYVATILFPSPFVIGFLSVMIFGTRERLAFGNYLAIGFLCFILLLLAVLATLLLWPFDPQDAAQLRVYLFFMAISPFTAVAVVYALLFMFTGTVVGTIVSVLIKR